MTFLIASQDRNPSQLHVRLKTSPTAPSHGNVVADKHRSPWPCRRRGGSLGNGYAFVLHIFSGLSACAAFRSPEVYRHVFSGATVTTPGLMWEDTRRRCRCWSRWLITNSKFAATRYALELFLSILYGGSQRVQETGERRSSSHLTSHHFA